MKRGKLRTFLTRLVLVFLVQTMIKIGDQTYESIFDISWRSIIFTAYFIMYWLTAWYVGAYFNNKIRIRQKKTHSKKQLIEYLVFIFHLVFGFTVSFFANHLYRIGDIHFFDMYETWRLIPILNPELTLSLLVIYMMVFYFDSYFQSIFNKKENELQLEKLKRENTLSKYLNLKAQIEPHFLFNSLSVLSSIIYTDTELASGFILRLSKILRYVIEKNELLTVPLNDEIRFVNDYFFLIKTRFEDSIIIKNEIDENLVGICYIPPVSLQLLIENAIKHNKFTSKKPLTIKLNNNNDYLIITNNLNIRNDENDNTKQGLKNLTKRFSFISEKAVKIETTNKEFIVSLPILTNKHNKMDITNSKIDN